METMASQVYKSLESYWQRRTYQRLRGSPRRKRAVIRLGGAKQRSWKLARVVRPILRLPEKIFSPPANLLRRLRDAYVNAALAFAGERASLPFSVSRSGGGSGRAAFRRPILKSFRPAGRGEFEKKMMIHIYNSVVAEPRVPELASCA